MSDTKPEQESTLKAGHPPAVKVAGGVRITQHKAPVQSVPKQSSKDEDDQDEQQLSVSPPKPMICNISGAPVRGNEDFPVMSVKAYHEKQPMPTNECRPKNAKQFIHQPKK